MTSNFREKDESSNVLQDVTIPPYILLSADGNPPTIRTLCFFNLSSPPKEQFVRASTT